MLRGIFSKIRERSDTMSATFLSRESLYYEKTARYYRTARYAVLLFTLLFVLVGGVICRKDIRAENFRYLFKYIDIDPVSTTGNYKDIHYASDEETFFTLYKGDITLVRDGRVSLYNIAGKNIMNADTGLDRAVCVSDGKYLVAYYAGEKKLTVFNSFSKLYEIDYDYPIMSVSAGKSGGFTVITKDADYPSVVYVYNDAFTLIYAWRSTDKFAFSSALSPDGESLALLSYKSAGANMLREISVRDVEKDKVELISESTGMMPLAVGYFEDGALYSLTLDSIEIYSSKLVSVYNEAFSDDVIMYSVVGDNIAVLTGKTRAGALLTLYSTDGHKRFSESFSFSVLDIEYENGRIYLLSEKGVHIISEKDGTEYFKETGTGVREMFVFDDGNVLLCYEKGTKLFKLSDFEKIN